MREDKAAAIGEGDRVDHRKFGLGTVTEVEGDIIEIDFDDRPGEIKRVLVSFVIKVASAETRPFKFWDRQWQPLRTAWLEARRAFETEASGFRPLPDAERLAHLKAEEIAAWEAMLAFTEDEKQGLHL